MPAPANEAHLPAQEAQARTHPRIPGPQRDPVGKGDPQAQAAEGPQAPDPLTADARRRRARLSRSGDFDRVYREGDSRGNRFLVVHAFARGESDEAAGQPRLGVSVGKRIGKAVQRNKVKRALRESFWELAPERVEAGLDYVIVARPGVEGLLEREGGGGVRDSLAELLGPEDGHEDDGGREDERLS